MPTYDDKLLNGGGLSHLVSTIKTELANKQDELISGTNIKTINNQSILGAGNIDIQGGGGGLPEYPTEDGFYNLMVEIDGQTQTLSWNPVTGVWESPTQYGNDLRIFQCVTINQINNGLEVY